MPITTDENLTGNAPYYREVLSKTDGNETLLKVDPEMSLTIEAVGSGSATLKYKIGEGADPTDFSGFTSDSLGAVTVNQVYTLPAGIRWVGLDISSGTWSLYIWQMKV